MKKITLALLLILFFTLGVFSQDEQIDNLQFEETPVIEQRPTYFAIGAGYVGNLLFMNLDDVNSLMTKIDLPEYKGSVYTAGAHGFTGIGIIPNIRLGFFGIGGSNSVEKNDTMNFGSKLSVGTTGFSIDYGYVLFQHFSLLAGINAGWSSIELEIYRTDKSNSWGNINNNQSGYFKRVEGDFWFVQPNLYMEYAITPFLMARAAAGYSFSFAPSWTISSSSELTDVPETMNTSGLNLQFGICVGLFNF
jgi:hypothetical protein